MTSSSGSGSTPNKPTQKETAPAEGTQANSSEPPVITPDLIMLDVAPGDTKEAVIKALASHAAVAGRADDAEGLTSDALTRESKSATGVPGGVAIPHCRTSHVEVPTLTFARLSKPVDFGSADGPADLVFLISAPMGGGKAHLRILSKLARSLVKASFRDSLREASDEKDAAQRILDTLAAKPKKKSASTASASKSAGSVAAGSAAGSTPVGAAGASAQSADSSDNAGGSGQAVTHLVAITACPTGIAHTYMAADSLSQTADARDDVEITVETQGSSGVTPLPPDAIKNADAVIFATDVGVKDRERFAGKPVIESGVKRAIDEPAVMIDEAVAASKDPHARRVKGKASSSSESSQEEGEGLGWGKRIQQALMTGVSYMIPFVAAGGLLMALAFVLSGADIAKVYETVVNHNALWNLPGQHITVDGETYNFSQAPLLIYLGAVSAYVGTLGMNFLVSALSGYIAYALGGRPGIAPGFIGGAVSVAVGAGFIGGLFTGLIAGLIAMWFNTLNPPRWLAGLMPVVIIPLVDSLITGFAMFILLGRPIASLMDALQNGLNSMSGSSAVLLGIILSLMMCFDLGGPINKAAYLFATAGLNVDDPASLKIMAAVMITGMVPPLALALATTLRPKLFNKAEQENGKAAWLLGLSFISEGAIPFAAADPLRVVPATMLGGAVSGAISMAAGVELMAPHGGVFVILAVTHVLMFFVSLVVGVVIAAAGVIALKTWWPVKTRDAAKSPASSAPSAQNKEASAKTTA